MTDANELIGIANLARQSIEPGLIGNGIDGTPKSTGACLHACLVVVMLIKRFGRGTTIVRGGSGSCGALDSQGRWRGHYWVEVQMPSGAVFVVDATADQFGYKPVEILPMEAASSRYRAGPQKEVDEAFADLANEFECGDLVLR